MRSVKNEKGAVLVFITLMIVLLMIMVGMGLDTGQLVYTRSQGQAAVDAAALSAASGLPVGAAQVTERVKAFNASNDYLNSPNNALDASKNLTYVNYDAATGKITDLPDISGANGVRVALEKTNPYTSVAAGTAMKSPVFLTSLMKLFGQSAPGTVDVSVSAVAALKAVPGIPVAIMEKTCGNNGDVKSTDLNKNVELVRSPAKTDNSCWTTYWDNPVTAPKIKACLTSSTESCSNVCGGIPRSDPIFLENGVVNSTYNDANAALPGKCWMVPVVPNSTKCNQTDQITGWASICVTDVTKGGAAADKYIKADVRCGQDLWRSDSNLCFSSRLVRDTKSGM